MEFISVSVIYSKSNDKIICVSNSNAEPFAISKNLQNSLSEFLPAPSAIFDGIETVDLLI
ncbi:MAG: hypothetical protein V3V16_02300 [Melioribacteraceae bacterium]